MADVARAPPPSSGSGHGPRCSWPSPHWSGWWRSRGRCSSTGPARPTRPIRRTPRGSSSPSCRCSWPWSSARWPRGRSMPRPSPCWASWPPVGLRCGSRVPAVAGFEPVFFLLIPAGRVMGRGFGFVLGVLTLVVSAMITGGVGPWLPVPDVRRRLARLRCRLPPPGEGSGRDLAAEPPMRPAPACSTGRCSTCGSGRSVPGRRRTFSFVPGAGLLHNLHCFILFDLTTSLGFDIPRALTNAVLVLVLGRPVLAALRRASRRAAFGAPVIHEPVGASGPGRRPTPSDSGGPPG